MRALLAIAIAAVLSACGSTYSPDYHIAITPANAPAVAPDNRPSWELLIPIPSADDVEVFTATINGYSGLVEGDGKDHATRLYDACAYIVSAYKPGTIVYSALLSDQGQLIEISGSRCTAKLLPQGLTLTIN